uniref:Uncharacterized protein n=1 Tax=Oryza rufipogon TaxID=4529 RepID=A0A0E0QR22_ORYRU
MRSLILDCMENDSKCPKRKDSTHVFEDVEQEQNDPREHVSNHNEESYINQNVNMTCETKSNQSRKRLTGPKGRTYKPTNWTDFIYETRVYIEKEDLTQQIIDKGPPKNALRGQKKTKTNGQTPLKNSEEGAHVEASESRDKRWIRDMARDYLPFDMKEVKTFRQDLAGILINSELNNIKDRPLLPTTT